MTNETTFVLPDPIPGYDPIKCKRESHARTRRETVGMTNAEIREYYHQRSKEFWAEQKRRRCGSDN